MASSVNEATLVVRPDIALAQWSEESSEAAAARGDAPDTTSTQDAGGPAATGTTSERRGEVRRRFYGVARLDPTRMSSQARDLAGDVVANLNALDGTVVEVTLEVRATNGDGFPESIRKLVSENADALGMREHQFEPE